jgi:hypothetical protein
VKVFVHRYKWSHDKKRKKYRRLLKENKVKLLLQNKDGWLYQEQPKGGDDD